MTAHSKNISTKNETLRVRRSVLASASVLALGGFLGSAAHAQSSVYTYTPPVTQSVPFIATSLFTHWFRNDQINLGAESAVNSVNNIFGTVSVGAPLLITNTNNSISSLANGNVYTGNLITGLGALGTGDTLGALSGQIQAATVNASTTNASIRISESSKDPGINILTGNQVLASTVLNQADVAATGKLPAGYTNGVLGSVTGGSSAAGINSTVTASTALVNHQTAVASGAKAGSSALVSGSEVALRVFQSNNLPFTTSQSVRDNSIAAEFVGNGSSTRFSADAGSAAVRGSVAVSNNQANIEAGAGGSIADTASVATSSILTDLRDTTAGVTEIEGPVVMTGNAITASSTGNSALAVDSGGNVSAGNVISLAPGVDMVGVNSLRSNRVEILNGSTTGQVQADLALSNGQGNSSTGLNSTVSAGVITVRADDVLSTGSVTLDKNTVASSVTGSTAGNRIQTDSAIFVGSVAAGNLQANNETTMLSTTSGADISANIGSLFNGATVSGKISVNSNAIDASARGNVVDTQVQLNANSLVVTSGDAGARTSSSGLGLAQTVAGTGATASNVQGNGGAVMTPITAAVSNSNVRATFVDQIGFATRVNLVDASVATDGNSITATGAGNSASTSVALGTAGGGTANAAGTAAVANAQDTDRSINGTIANSGVRMSALNVTAGSKLTADENTLAASATANSADNSVSSTATNLTLGGRLDTVAESALVNAAPANLGTYSGGALAIASGQNNKGSVVSSNISNAPFVVIDILGVTTDSNASVSSNQVSSITTGNDVSNAVTVVDSNLTSSGRVASISNLQQNAVTGVAQATVQNTGPATAPAIGVLISDNVTNSPVTVSGNAATASVLGNTANNSMDMAVKNYSGVNGDAVAGAAIRSVPGTDSWVDTQFALVNRQVDAVSGGRTAINSGVSEAAYVGGSVIDSNVTVSLNTSSAEAFNNEATNSIRMLAPLNTNLTASAGALNDQSSTTNVGATVSGSSVGIRVGGNAVTGSNLVVGNNTVKGLAVGNSANNDLAVKNVNLIGDAVVSGSVIDPATGELTANSDYGLGNVQRQTGNVTSAVTTSMRMNVDLAGTLIIGGSATMTGNKVQSIAQSNSASSDVELDTVNVRATSAVASYQNATGVVSATQSLDASGATFGVIAADGTTRGTPLVVSNNSILASAGQNQAFNAVDVNATVLSGQSINNASAYVVGGNATAGSDYSVLNVQTGVGSVTANANPGLIGTRIPTITGSSVTVNGNDVTAKATVNDASNSLLLNAGATLNATGVVNNVQTNTAFNLPVAATVTGGSVGIGLGIVAPTLSNTVATASNNTINAIAGGNNAANAMEATAPGSIAGSAAAPTFAVLNYQGNTSAMAALVTGTAVGINFGPAPGTMGASTATVNGNQVLASGYGNMASNGLTMSVLIGNGNAATSTVSNTQLNTAAIGSTATGVNIGVSGGSTTGASAVVVSGNSITAQSVGNSATNKLASK
jgi:hypothetical protein